MVCKRLRQGNRLGGSDNTEHHGFAPGSKRASVTGAPYREVNSKVATAPKLKVEDKDRVNNSRRFKTVKLNIVKLKASLNKFSRGKVGYRSRMSNA